MTDPRHSPPVLAVDGPSGTGKGTLCGRLAASLAWHLLDSGAVYRALACTMEGQGLTPDEGAAVARLARGLPLTFHGVAGPGADAVRVLLDGVDVSDRIRSEACGALASRIAAVPAVREALLGLQRSFRQPPGLVADGRDMGTVVFPDAEVKVFLTASVEERARRRHKQLKEKGIGVSLPRLFADIAVRDKRDRTRSISPLKPSEDAHIVDTTELSIEEVHARVMKIVADTCPHWGINL